MLLIGIAGLGGNQVGVVSTAIRPVEGPSAWLATVIGAVLLASLVFDAFTEQRGRPEQKWEPVADEGIVLAINGRWDEANTRFQKAIAIAGPAPRRLRAAERIGSYLQDRGKLREAIPYLCDALVLREQTFGPAQDTTRALRERVSDLYLKLGDGASAAQLLETQLNLVAPSGHVITLESARIASKLAQALKSAGDLTGAADASQRAIAAIETADPYSPDLVDALVVSAQFSIATSDHTKAEAMLKRALECADRVGSQAKAQLARDTLLNLYLASERYSDAVPLSERLLAGAESSGKTMEVGETARRNRQHAEVLEKADRPADAARYRRIADTLERLSSSPGQPS